MFAIAAVPAAVANPMDSAEFVCALNNALALKQQYKESNKLKLNNPKRMTKEQYQKLLFPNLAIISLAYSREEILKTQHCHALGFGVANSSECNFLYFGRAEAQEAVIYEASRFRLKLKSQGATIKFANESDCLK
jgi:hypothetical protein